MIRSWSRFNYSPRLRCRARPTLIAKATTGTSTTRDFVSRVLLPTIGLLQKQRPQQGNNHVCRRKSNKQEDGGLVYCQSPPPLVLHNHNRFIHLCPFSSLPVPQEDPFFEEDAVDKSHNNTIEEQYSRKTPLEHILLRPGMYIGPTERLPPSSSWVLDPPPPPATIILNNNNNTTTSTSTTTTTAITTALPDSTTLYTASQYRMIQQEVSVVPALIKIFDEILVNASDQRLRHPDSCTRLQVTIDPGCTTGSTQRSPCIIVSNNGPGIPIELHKGEQLYVPDMLFGHLLTGSNFDDSVKRVTGGRHGYGAKLTNIFSSMFHVETIDSSRKLLYQQTWTNNMQQSSAPQIIELKARDARAKEDSTTITFVPDMSRLAPNSSSSSLSKSHTYISPEDYAVMCRRVIDVAGCNASTSSSLRHKVFKVTLNGIDVTQPDFASYCLLYRKQSQHQQLGLEENSSINEEYNTNHSSDRSVAPVCFCVINDRWTVGVGKSESGSLEAVSFVNGMATPRGGTHVNALVNQLCKRIVEKVERLDKERELAALVSPGLVRRHLFLCVNALIENPSFDSQMKEYLTSNPNQFGSSCTLSDKFINQHVLKPLEEGGPGILEEVMRVARGRKQASLLQAMGVNSKKTQRQLMSMIPKLEDAHGAGNRQTSQDCTLILTEGDSAKALAVAGLEEIGRKTFGVFPLRGKFLNVRHATLAQLASNGEVKALCAILGLDFDKEYDTVEERKGLRYGNIMLMTDQDNDGSHIKGLVINFFRHYWPRLLQPPLDQPPEMTKRSRPFLSSFVTPLLKATKKSNKKGGKGNKILSFYSMPEYQAWRESLAKNEGERKKWSVKYYKGLGTSTPMEAKQYFSAFDHHHRPFYWRSESDGELLDMVFDKERASDRRNWILEEFDESASIVVDPSQGNRVSYEDFVNKEMIHFSHADNIRSIPCLIDGLKPSQRKVLYACFKRNLKSEIKVAQLTGYCAEHTAYHHGEASLQSTIIGMAQDFVGSNNINLLVPSGQFGTRLAGGQDAASPRYIFTELAPIARYLFPEADDQLLDYREDDGQLIEPEYYCPVIPLLLVNGAQGIGTGWSTFIPTYDPKDVLNYIRAKLDDLDFPHIRPYARGFTGTFEAEADANNGYVSVGRCKSTSSKSVLIEELPLRTWTNKYKEKLLQMRERGELVDFTENHTTSQVEFHVEIKRAQMHRIESSGFDKFFKLRSSLPTTNMHAFDGNYQMQKFGSAESIADAFFPVRLNLYHDRKSLLESERKYAAAVLRNKARFIEVVTNGQMKLTSGRKSKLETVSELEVLGFDTATSLQAIKDDNALVRRRRAANSTHRSGSSLSHDGTAPTNIEDVPNHSLESTSTSTSTPQSSASSEFDFLLNMPLSSLTLERIADLRRDAEQKDKDVRLIQNTSAEDLWRNDLDALATVLSKYE